MLHRWEPGSEPTPRLSLSDVGLQLVEPSAGFDRLFVHGDDAVLLDGGRLWHVELDSKHLTEVSGSAVAIARSPAGVVYSAAGRLHAYTFQDRSQRDLSALIESCASQITKTHADVHESPSELAWNGRIVAYTTGWGVFAIDLQEGTVVPLLLTPDTSAEVRVPTIVIACSEPS